MYLLRVNYIIQGVSADGGKLTNKKAEREREESRRRGAKKT